MKFKKFLNSLFFVIPFITIPFLILIIIYQSRWVLDYEGLPFSQVFWPTILFIIFPAFFLFLTSFLILKIFKSLQEGKSLISKTKPFRSLFYSFYLLVCLMIIFFVSLIIYTTFTDKPPNFFPFDDPDAIYTISKQNGIYYINYKTTSEGNKSYVCEWVQGGEKKCNWELNQNIGGIAIGKSPVELKLFLNKNLKLSGDFIYDNKQCIVNRCQDIGKRAVLNIDSIEEAINFSPAR